MVSATLQDIVRRFKVSDFGSREVSRTDFTTLPEKVWHPLVANSELDAKRRRSFRCCYRFRRLFVYRSFFSVVLIPMLCVYGLTLIWSFLFFFFSGCHPAE